MTPLNMTPKQSCCRGTVDRFVNTSIYPSAANKGIREKAYKAVVILRTKCMDDRFDSIIINHIWCIHN